MNQIQRITFQNGALQVPNTPIIPFIEGDGVGRDIWPATRRVTDAAIRHAYGTERRIDWLEVPAGEMARRISQQPLPINSMDTLQRHPIAIKGPLETPVGGGMRSLNVMLRQALDLYVCLRPVRWFRGVEAPVRHPEKVDMVIFRENTEDIYAGIEWEQGTPEAGRLLQFLRDEMQVSQIRFPATSSLGVKPVSREGSERLVRAAIRYALRTGRRSVTLVHKGNIMKYTEGGFRKWGYALAEREFGAAIASGQLTVNDVIADAFLQNTLLRPDDYSVVATLNLNGDYVSDQLAAMVGGIGIAPGANINYETGHAIFEATHGTAPDIAGRGVANPSSLLLSAAMMLEYMGWDEAARLITQSIEAVLQQKRATADLARLMTASTTLGTEDFASELIAALQDM